MATLFSLGLLWIPIALAIYVFVAIANWAGGRDLKIVRMLTLGLAWILAMAPGGVLVWLVVSHRSVGWQQIPVLGGVLVGLVVACVAGIGILLLKSRKLEALRNMPRREESLRDGIIHWAKWASRTIGVVALVGTVFLTIMTGWMMYMYGQKKSAVNEKALIAAVNANPKDAKAHRELGEYYAREGRYKDDVKIKKEFQNNAFVELTGR